MTIGQALATIIGTPIGIASENGGSAFDVLNLSPDVWFETDSGAVTGGSRRFTPADKACFEIANPSDDLKGSTSGFWRAGWFNADSVSGTQYIIDCDASTGGYFIALANTSLQASVRENGGPTNTATASTTINAGQSYFWYMEYDGTNVSVAVGDAALVSAAGAFSQTTSSFIVGALNGTANFFGGFLSRHCGGDGTLSIAERAALYNGGSGLAYGAITLTQKTDWDLKFYHGFNEAATGLSGTGLVDSHGTNDLTFAAMELLSNTGFETLGVGGTDVFANWVEAASGTSTVNVETVDVRTGSRALKLILDASNNNAQVSQSILTPGNGYNYSAPAKISSVGGEGRVLLGSSNTNSFALTTSYAVYSGSGVATGDALFIIRRGSSTSGKTLYFDDVSCKAAGIPAANGLGTSGAVADGDPMIAWTSQDASSRVANQASAPKRFKWLADSGNGYPVARADGVDDYMQVLFGSTLPQPFTRITVFVPRAWVSGAVVVGGSSNAVNLQQSTSTPRHYINAGTVGPYVSPTLGQPCIIVEQFNGASSSVSLNGGTPIVGDAGANSIAGLTLGASHLLASFSQIDLIGVGVFPTPPTASQLRSVLRYLSNKYEIPLA